MEEPTNIYCFNWRLLNRGLNLLAMQSCRTEVTQVEKIGRIWDLLKKKGEGGWVGKGKTEILSGRS